ncbi:hypothetical protein RS84_02351 [Microbacterium hydrocarbonoxydans]|uniref:Oligosaccharide repeat unit polymerase n=2 Tax=Microbacterium hydrocarbonoxydans TaxID=273678 RepID=A0A0M2HSS8_9MICO|nr:hypothetical protein RS84_02351 [Microbacterium hydrocarbonoxydans]
MVLFLAGGVLGQNYLYDASSTFLLFALAASFNLVPLLVSKDLKETPKLTQTQVETVILMPAWVIAVTAMVGFLGALQLSVQLGTPLISASSISRALEASSDNAALIYRGEVVRSTFGTVSYALMQFGFAALGVRMRARPNRWTWFVLLLSLISAASWTIVTTQRSYFLVSFLWLVAGYIAAAVAVGNEKVSWKLVAWGMSAVAALTLFVVGARAIRVAGANAQLNESSWSSASLWAAGYIPTFSSWHSSGGGTVIYPLRLLSGVLALTGTGVDAGTDADNEEFTYIGAGQLSNASTMMRAVVLGSGDVAAFLVVVLFGAVSIAIYRGAQQRRVFAIAAYIGVVATIIWSVNAWHFSNANRVLAQVVLLVAFGLSVALMRRRERLAQRRLRRRPTARVRAE